MQAEHGYPALATSEFGAHDQRTVGYRLVLRRGDGQVDEHPGFQRVDGIVIGRGRLPAGKLEERVARLRTEVHDPLLAEGERVLGVPGRHLKPLHAEAVHAIGTSMDSFCLVFSARAGLGYQGIRRYPPLG